MPTQKQYDVTLQNVRQIDCKIAVLNYDYTLLDEISGLTKSIQLNVNADSDIRRTADVVINLKDDISKNQNHAFYWTAGNIYWFDKFIQIYTAIKDIRSGEDVWVNQGIYCINAPSISYDAASNELSFQAVDLVSKMTGMRDGQMQGTTTSIPADSSIKNAIETILLEQGFNNYILYDPPQTRTVDDVNIDAGGTAWDLLTQLRDINSNWEMFFDVDGVFHFQEIPSGKVITSETSNILITDLITNTNQPIVTNSNVTLEIETDTEVEYGYGEPTPLVDEVIWEKALISASYDTNFEDVKNYVEVYGKSHEASEVAKAVQPSTANYINITLNKSRDKYVNGSHVISFMIGEGIIPEALAYPIYYIHVYDADNQASPWFIVSAVNEPIITANETYCIRMTVGVIPEVVSGEYIGYLQPRAYAIENNPDSPFYVGQFTQYTCKLGTDVDFASNNDVIVADVDAKGDTVGHAVIDIRPWLSAEEYSAASQYDEWYFKIHLNLADLNIPTTFATILGAGSSTTRTIYGTSGQQISLDYVQDYMLVVMRGSSSSISDAVIAFLYYPTEASQLPMSTCNVVNLPKFNNQVRCVCAGGEYDNIYSNDLAAQRARYEIYLRSRLHDNINIQCVPIYWLDVNQIIEYRLPNSVAKESDYWLVKSISTDVSVEGRQTIDAMRYYPEYAQI